MSRICAASLCLAGGAGAASRAELDAGNSIALVQTCVGDCDARGAVTVDELVLLVSALLGVATAEDCTAADGNADGEVAVDDLVTAVNGALAGCADERSRGVDALISRIANDTTPAAAVLVRQGDRILHRRVYGMANLETGEPATAQHVFLMASVSKPFTSLAVLNLLAENLDAPIATYLPELERFGDGVTVRHLLQHTSGLPDYYIPPLWNELLQIAPLPTNADGLALLSSRGAASFAPGEQFYYLNGGFDLLALIVERLSGQRFTDFQQSFIFDAVGMPSSFSLPRPELEASARYAYSYQPLPANQYRRYEYDASINMYGAGDVVSNIDDLARFDRALFAGALIPLDLLEQAFVPTRLNDGSEPLVPFIPETKYGYGWFLSTRGTHPYVGHEGIYLGYRNFYAHFPDDDLTVIVLTARDLNFVQLLPRYVLPIADLYLPETSL